MERIEKEFNKYLKNYSDYCNHNDNDKKNKLVESKVSSWNKQEIDSHSRRKHDDSFSLKRKRRDSKEDIDQSLNKDAHIRDLKKHKSSHTKSENKHETKRSKLDDNLNLKSKEVVAEVEANTENSDFNKKRSIHPIKVPEVLIGKIKPFKHLYLHIIDIQPNVRCEEPTNSDETMTLYHLYTHTSCFGLLTSKKLPSLCKFSVYVSLGEIIVNVDINKSTFALNETEIHQLRAFQNLIFRDILKVLKSCLVFNNEEDAEGVLVVPIQKTQCKIDFEVIRKHPSLIDFNQKPSIKQQSETIVDDNYLGRIVSPWYRQKEQFYVVISIPLFTSAYTEFPNTDFNNYANYYKVKHSLTVYSPCEPLLLVKGISPKMNFLNPCTTKKINNENKREEHLLAEFCVRQTFPGSLWMQSYLLPCILHRIFGLLQAYELRKTIEDEAGIEHQLKTVIVNKDFKAGSDSDVGKKYEDKKLNTLSSDVLKAKASNDSQEINNKVFITKSFNLKSREKEKNTPINIKKNVLLTPKNLHDTIASNKIDNKMTKKIGSSNQVIKGLPAIGFNKKIVEKQILFLNPLRANDGPKLVDILQSLTTTKANDIVNLERMETLGDCFLKLTVTIFILMKYPAYDEGEATMLKCKLINNKHLYNCGVEKKLNEYVKADEFLPNSEWKPPGYCLPKFIAEKVENGNLDTVELKKISISKDEQISGTVDKTTTINILKNFMNDEKKTQDAYESSLGYINKRIIWDKTVADSVEALIGTYFMSCGIQGGLKLIKWLNIIPNSKNLLETFTEEPNNSTLSMTANINDTNVSFPSWQIVEKELGYHFKNRAYLLQAFTHSSYTSKCITASYERLEFLGDAILDFLITCHIYETCDNLNPGQLTDLRSALVNNITFAGLTVRCGFHNFLLLQSDVLLNCINNFVEYQESRNHEIKDDILILFQKNNLYMADHIEVPKILGDLFEALAGAVYLDSGKDLNTVWKVFYRIMWKEIKIFKSNVPKNVVRMLHETLRTEPAFQPMIKTDDGRVMVPLDFMLNDEKKRVFGVGKNKVFAKKAASKLALQLLSSE